MFLTRCQLTLHDMLFYATREMGRLYETGEYLHNYGLTYALGLVPTAYFQAVQVPRYAGHLEPLNQRGVYITPARPLQYDFMFHTFKRASTPYYTYQPQTTVNVPLYGRAKELAPGSVFEFFVFSSGPMTLPHWIRLGKWMSKAEVQVTWNGEPSQSSGEFVTNHPLNPLDVPNALLAFDIISMPPVSLVNNAHLEGTYYEIDGIKLPAGMRYTFP
jgi:CRISPR-associated protein Csc1